MGRKFKLGRHVKNKERKAVPPLLFALSLPLCLYTSNPVTSVKLLSARLLKSNSLPSGMCIVIVKIHC